MVLNKKLLKPTYFIALLMAFLIPLTATLPVSAAAVCYMATRDSQSHYVRTFCDTSQPSFKDGVCNVEQRGGPSGTLQGYTQIDPCVNPDGTPAPDSTQTAPATDETCAAKPPDDICHNVIVTKYINPAINFLAVGFGIIVTIMVVLGGIQYITSGSDPQKVAAAKGRIFNAILALLAFAFMYVILQWLVPGGLF